MNNKVIYVDFKSRSKKASNLEVTKQGFLKIVFVKLRNIFNFSSMNKTEIKAYNFRNTM